MSTYRTCFSISCAFLFLFVFSNNAYSQKFSGDYVILNDTAYTQGVIRLVSNKSVKFRKSAAWLWTEFSADQVTDFRHDEKVYKSFSIDGNKEFFKMISNGNYSLFRNKRRKLYAVKSKDTLVLISKSNFKSSLADVLNCKNNLQFVHFSKPSLKTIIDQSNKNLCDSEFPRGKTGIYVGLNSYQFDLNLSYSNATFKNSSTQSSLAIGVFRDIPFLRANSLYFTPELFGLYSKLTFYSESGYSTKYAAINMIGVVAPLSLKYYFINKKTKSYVKAGGTTGYLGRKSADGFIETIPIGTQEIDVKRTTLPSTYSLLIGLNAAVGFEFPFRDRKRIHTEIKYLKTTDTTGNSFSTNLLGLSLIAGISF